MKQSGPTGKHRKEIRQVFTRYQSAVFGKNVDAFVALYAEDVRIFDLWGRWAYTGTKAWRGMAAGWLGSLGDEQVKVEWEDVQITVTPGLGVAHAFITFKGLSAAGRELRAMRERLTWALRPENGVWKIVHQHTSAPIDFGTMKIIQKR